MEERCRKRTAPYREVIKAKALLMADDGLRNVEITAHIGVDARTISVWRKEFLGRGRESLLDRPRPGRQRSFSP
ncbi:MAG: helix-turn-helix domain-containing protein [Armatimonadetes bacterium]|nr:helix-turn-helix domain-containing protein [Armatimonadota bacterium]